MILNFINRPSKKSSNSIKSTLASVFNRLETMCLLKMLLKFLASTTCWSLSEGALSLGSSDLLRICLIRSKKSKVVFVKT